MTDQVPSNETLSELFGYVIDLSHDMDTYHSQKLMEVAGIIGGVIASRAPVRDPPPDGDHLDWCTPQAREQRPSKELMSHWHCPHHGGFDARVAVGCPECVREMREELKRLRTALRGIQSCSTCEACRGAATRALGGASAEPDPELQRRAEYADRFHEVCQLAVTHLGKFCPNDFRSARKGEFVAAVYAAAESALNGAGEIPPLLRATQPPGDGQ